MSEYQPFSSIIDTVSKAITVFSLALGVFATWLALPADSEIKKLQAETAKLDLALKQADADLKSDESSRKITLELYQEVKKVIEKTDKNPREEDAVRVLVESLADDPFRWKLLQVISVGAKSPEVKVKAAATATYYQDQSVVQTRPIPSESVTTTTKKAMLSSYNVDIFFCEEKRVTSELVAKAALNLKSEDDTGRWRVRLLPESINQQPGYGITGNEIRFTPPEERPIAQALATSLSTIGVQIQLRETAYPTPNYVSVFICQ